MSSTPTAPESYLQGSLYPPTYQIVRHFVDFLQWRFSLLPAGAYQWRPADAHSLDGRGQSEIFIGSDTPIDPVVVGQRPAITVLRSQAAFNGVGINDRAYIDWKTGAEVKMDLVPTTIMVNCLSTLPVEAERIAFFAGEQVWAFREEIIQTLPCLLYTGQRPSFSAPSPAGSLVQSTEHEWTVVVVAFPTYLQHSITKEPLNRTVVGGLTANVAVVPPEPKVLPSVPLQGTSPGQPKQTAADRAALTEGRAAASELPQEGGNEASSSEPLTVQIKT